MSRIGNKIVTLPEGVSASVDKNNNLKVKGDRGELMQKIDRDIKIEIKDGKIQFKRPTDQLRHKAMHGLYRSLAQNMVQGVSEGFKKQMELVGIGFKATHQGNILDLSIGFSHNILVEVPKELKLSTETVKGKNPIITIEGIDKQLLGQICAKIRNLRKPEPYKGKGIRYLGEEVRRKAGKSASS